MITAYDPLFNEIDRPAVPEAASIVAYPGNCLSNIYIKTLVIYNMLKSSLVKAYVCSF